MIIGPSSSSLVYSFIACTFFAFCAWAQINDPNALCWVGFYVCCGCLTSLFVVFLPAKKITHLVLITAVCAASGTALMHILDVFSAFDFSKENPSITTLTSFCWQVLELEQGRDALGAILLLVHNAALLDVIRKSVLAQKRDSHGDRKEKSTLLLLSSAAALLAIASYLWIEYQPEMNAKYNVPHCNGVFV